MARKSSIEWTGATWNPVTGCSKISLGCQNCYAERTAKRLQAMGHRNYTNGFEVTLHEEPLGLPLRWRTPEIVFVNSMSGPFHEQIPEEFIRRVFDVMIRADWHVFQILTKRSARLVEFAPALPWEPHIWMGVTVENQDHFGRVDDLRRTEAQVRFVPLEPLLGPVPGLDVCGVDWVIVGGESGPRAPPMQAEWARSIRDKWVRAGVPFFFKQWGGRNEKAARRVLDGRTWDEMPSTLCRPGTPVDTA